MSPATPTSAVPTPPPFALPPGNSTPTASSSTAPAPRSRRWVTPVFAIIVAAVVIVGILGAAGFLFHKTTANTTEPYATLNEADSVAGPAAVHALSGSWNAVLAAGIRLPAQVSLLLANLSSVENLTSGCTLTAVPGAPTSITVDATPNSVLAGHAAFWLVGLSNGAGSIALVSVDLGNPVALYSFAGSTCATELGDVVGFPSTESDSPALVAAANASGGAAFLAQYPSATQLLAGLGGISVDGFTSPPFWEVVDTSCPLPLLLNETGAEFNATLTGAPANVETHATGPVNCAAGLGSSLPGASLVTAPLLLLAALGFYSGD
ncbi:MAG: hypothetical protein WB789_05865 [Thermoplasmata archaeon]